MPGKKKASKKKGGKKEKKSTGEGLTPSEVKQLQKEKDFAELSVKAAEEKIRLLHQKQQLLREQLRNQEDDTREFLTQFQKKVQAAEEKNAALLLQMDKQREKFERERARTAARFEAKVGAMSEKFAALESGSDAELHDLKQELAGLKDFRDYKAKVTAQISALEGELVGTQHRHATHLAQLERKFIGEKAQLKKVHDDQYQAIVEDARDEALKGFEADTRAIIAANRRMTKELQFQRRQCEDLQETSDALAAKNKELRRDAELAAQSAELAAQASVRQKRKLAKTAARAEVAEKTLRSAEFAHTRTATQRDAKRAREVDDARVTVEGLRKLVRAKDKELRTIKNLAKSIMNQRSETEQYFLQALEQVKSEVRDKRRVATMHARAGASAARRSGTGGSGTLPKVSRARGAASFRGTRRQYDDEFAGTLPVDITLSGMSSDDRERVLRLLLAKINHARLAASPRRDEAPEVFETADEADEGSFFLTT